MAEGFARAHGANAVEAFSAGTRPAGAVDPRTIDAMAAAGVDIAAQRSKSVDEVEGPFDYVITMGCGDECPAVAGIRRDDWPLEDPVGLTDRGLNQVRDEIERRVLSLLEEIRG